MKKAYNFLPARDCNHKVFSYFCCMHRFIEYISDLLFLHDCVIIPDFGGFICNYTSAYIDKKSGLLCPPGKDILFNRNLTQNDGLLANWIAMKENISYEKATTQLTLFSEELKIRLNQCQSVDFGEIGRFYTDRRFNIIFENGKHNFFSEALGMNPISIQSVDKSNTNPIHISMSTTPSSERVAYSNAETSGNFFQRLLKYGLAVATVAGVVVVSQVNIFHSESGLLGGKLKNSTTLRPEFPSVQNGKKKVTHHNVISPVSDYVDYNPIDDFDLISKENKEKRI